MSIQRGSRFSVDSLYCKAGNHPSVFPHFVLPPLDLQKVQSIYAESGDWTLDWTLSMGRSAIGWNPGAARSVKQTKHKILLLAVATPGLLTQFVQCVVSSFVTNSYVSHVVLFAQRNTVLHIFRKRRPINCASCSDEGHCCSLLSD